MSETRVDPELRILKVKHLIQAVRLTCENVGDAPTRTGLPMPAWLSEALQEHRKVLQNLDKDQKQAYARALAQDIIAVLTASRSFGLYVEKALGAELVLLCEGEGPGDA